jgi:hypothetical protein
MYLQNVRTGGTHAHFKLQVVINSAQNGNLSGISKTPLGLSFTIIAFSFFGLHCTYIYEGHVEPTIENKEYKV